MNTTTELPLARCCAPVGSSSLSDEQAEDLERVFKALADRHRLKILNLLVGHDGEAVCVCDFEELLGMKQSGVSYHLKQLVDAGMLERTRKGTYSYYRLMPGALERVGTLVG